MENQSPFPTRLRKQIRLLSIVQEKNCLLDCSYLDCKTKLQNKLVQSKYVSKTIWFLATWMQIIFIQDFLNQNKFFMISKDPRRAAAYALQKYNLKLLLNRLTKFANQKNTIIYVDQDSNNKIQIKKIFKMHVSMIYKLFRNTSFMQNPIFDI